MIYLIFIFLFIIFYTFIGYPYLLRLLAKLFEKPVKVDKTYQPEIAIVISAYNEEAYIEDAIVSVFENGYPNEKIKVYLGSDGSQDKTIEIAEKLKLKYPNLLAFDYPRAGKNMTLNKLVPKTKENLIFYLDADCRLLPGVLEKSVSYFADQSIGVVLVGTKPLILGEDSKDTGRLGETSYQKYERIMRINESKVQSTVNSLGTFFGIRREYYQPLPNDKVCDDYMPLLQTALKKQRIYFIEDVFVYEVRTKSLSDEFNRRIRASSCGMASIWRERRLLNPEYGWIPLFLWSHKIFRWLTPFNLIFIALFTVLLTEASAFKMPLVLIQSVFYLSAFLGWVFERINLKIIPFNISIYVVTMNIGLLFAFFRFLGGVSNATWSRDEIP
jgi:biofilm PGA synthesis N-glycosyltransferase PgaC